MSYHVIFFSSFGDNFTVSHIATCVRLPSGCVEHIVLHRPFDVTLIEHLCHAAGIGLCADWALPYLLAFDASIASSAGIIFSFVGA
jgi:hypothetical protein